MASLTLFNSMIHIKSTTTPTVFCIHISDCKIEEKNGFLKYVCHENEDGTTVYKCTHSEEFYAPHQNFVALKIFYAYEICSNDPHFYQVCDTRLGGKITNDHVLCEYYLCDGRKQHGRTWTSIALSKSGRWQAPAAVLPEGPKNMGGSHSRARRAREWPKHASPRARRARGRAKLSLRFGACQCYYMFLSIQPKIAIFTAQLKYLTDNQKGRKLEWSFILAILTSCKKIRSIE